MGVQAAMSAAAAMMRIAFFMIAGCWGVGLLFSDFGAPVCEEIFAAEAGAELVFCVARFEDAGAAEAVKCCAAYAEGLCGLCCVVAAIGVDVGRCGGHLQRVMV